MTQEQLSIAIGAHKKYINRVEAYPDKHELGEHYKIAILDVLNDRLTDKKLTYDDLFTSD